jgi:hypothetical protein
MVNVEAMPPMYAEQNPFPVSSGALSASRRANVNHLAKTTAALILNVRHAALLVVQMANAASTALMPARDNNEKFLCYRATSPAIQKSTSTGLNPLSLDFFAEQIKNPQG